MLNGRAQSNPKTIGEAINLLKSIPKEHRKSFIKGVIVGLILEALLNALIRVWLG